MEILKWMFYILIGGIAIYLIFSPFMLVIGLFNPSAVLSSKEPQTRSRVLNIYGISTAILLTLIGFSAFSSLPTEESVYAATTYSAPSIETASVSTPVVQEIASYSEPDLTEIWTNVKSDRAVQVVAVETINRIVPNNEFMKPVEAKGGQLVVIGMKLKNSGQESGDMMYTKFQLLDSQGRKYNEINNFEEMISLNAWLKENDVEEAGSQMFPGETIKIAKVFRVASDASDFKLVVNGNLISIS
ncbi:hypothetical protein [Nostoc commune]|uniref:hypothetical protein n=1 Tax=Nostoc commune TaxID=1178 RepID=UPI0018C4E095|nr:hypothetical protein [Nostoc commune]MBG1258336.1 DUF4352 domain-containing protein [Nostoc commune BAE]